MNISSVDNEDIEIVTKGRLLSEITDIRLKGSNLFIEGYATMEGVFSYSESRIRKMLLIIPKVNFQKYREDSPEEIEKTDTEILDELSLKIPLENCQLNEIVYTKTDELSEYEETLSGFKGNIDLSTINGNKPLGEGDYNVFISLEQLDNANDSYKYEKVISLSNSRKFLKNNVFTTRLDYFSTNKVLKYSLIASFDNYSKTLHFKNTVLQSYNPRDMYDGESSTEHRKIRRVKNLLFRIFYMLFKVIPIRKNKIVFASDSREELTGNFFFIYEELLKRNLELENKFLLKNNIDDSKSLLELISMAYHFATAKIILLDDFYPMVYPLKIRKNADLIQVWHAAGAFKTFGFSRVGRPGGPSPRSKNHRNYTKAAVSSEGVRANYAEGFGILEEKVYATGVPRADIFFDEEYKEYVRKSLYERYPILKEKKVILFAPTFRGNGQSSAHYPYENLELKELYEELGDEYIFLLKIHPFVKNRLTIPYEYADFFIDFSDYREINDLLLVTDILITDYSSVCFEFALLNKPMLFFSFDVEEYIATRDFYYDYFSFIPGPLIRTTKEMIKVIQEKDFELEKIPPFVDYFFNGTLGKASKNVVDQLIIPSLEGEDILEKEEHEALPPASSRKELFDRTLNQQDDNNS